MEKKKSKQFFQNMNSGKDQFYLSFPWFPWLGLFGRC